MTKKKVSLPTAIIVVLLSAFFINTVYSTPQMSIQSFGEISSPGNSTNSNPMTVILRSISVTSLNPSSVNITTWVDNFVSNYQGFNAVTISDLHPYGILWFGYSFSQTQGTWMGWTFSQLKQLIDSFHAKGWKVGLETTAIAWEGQQEYNYITQQHPELSFTNANGQLAAQTDAGTNNIIPDWFATYTTTDTANNIPAGSELLNVYTTRLMQMIRAGLSFDFWFGTDGWNGLNMEGYSWDSTTAANCYSFSVQELNDYGNWSHAILPSPWNPDSNIAMASNIIGNSAMLNAWSQFWQIQFADIYAQIKQAFINAGESPNTFHTIGTIDVSTNQGGNLGPAGMYNMTDLANAHAIDYFYTDQESNSLFGNSGQNMVGRDNALVAAYAKGFGVQPIIGLQPVNWLGVTSPLWSVEQSYLQQAINYIWINGSRQSVASPNIIMMQYPDTSYNGFKGWTSSDVNQLISFIQSTANILDNSQPIYLGPSYFLPSSPSGSFGYAVEGLNYSFAQWGLVSNVMNNPSYLNSSMNTLLLDVEGWGDSGYPLIDLSSQVMNMFANGQLNLWAYYSKGRDWNIANYAFNNGTAESTIENDLGILYSSYGNSASSTNLAIYNDSVVTNNSGQNIISGYTNQVYAIPSVSPNYYSTTMTTLASYPSENNRLAIGTYTNSNGSNAVFTCGLSFKNNIQVPREIGNRLLYWDSNSPVVPSESLIDLKVYRDGSTVYIPMTDQLDVNEGLSISSVGFSLNINPSALGLGSISNYLFSWASNPTATWTESSWNDLSSLVLNNGADVLIISPSPSTVNLHSNASTGIWYWSLNENQNDSSLSVPLTQVQADLKEIRSMNFTYIVFQDYGWSDGYDRGNFSNSVFAKIIPLVQQAGLKVEIGAFPDHGVPILSWNISMQSDYSNRFKEMGAWLQANGFISTIQGINVDNIIDDFGGYPPTVVQMNELIRDNIGIPDLPIYYDSQNKNWGFVPPDANTFIGSYDYSGDFATNYNWQVLIQYNNATSYSQGLMYPILCSTSLQAWNASEIQSQVDYCVSQGNMTRTIEYFSWQDNVANNPSQWSEIAYINSEFLQGLA